MIKSLFNLRGNSNPAFPEKLMQLDYLVFSSHKSGTQTIVHSLASSGFKRRHCHLPENLGLDKGQFKSYVNVYFKQNSKKLKIISVFRNPLERHISSFFQWYGSRPVERKEVQHEKETIIYQKSVPDLQRQFIQEIKNGSLHGLEESIRVVCDELNINPHRLSFDTSKKTGIIEKKNFRIYLLRFDLLFGHFEQLLSDITGRKIDQVNQNISSEKWYSDKYRDFKNSLHLPENMINDIYKRNHLLINIFYPGRYQQLLVAVKKKYGSA